MLVPSRMRSGVVVGDMVLVCGMVLEYMELVCMVLVCGMLVCGMVLVHKLEHM